MPFLERMQYTAVSGDLKMAKPEPEIFQHLLGVIGKPARGSAPSSMTSTANIATAQALGIKAVLFKNDRSATRAAGAGAAGLVGGSTALDLRPQAQ